MKGFVSSRRTSILAWVWSLSILWALFVDPGQPWTGLVLFGALSLLLVSSAVLLLGVALPSSLAPAIQPIDGHTTGRKS
jgi:hypothetical protein